MEEHTFDPRPKSHFLPKSLTTVTAFSKVLALFLFILLPFVGFYVGIEYGLLLAQSSQTQQVVQKSASKLAVPSKIISSSPTPTCKPRPACLDATPRCMIAETSDMCSKTITPSP